MDTRKLPNRGSAPAARRLMAATLLVLAAVGPQPAWPQDAAPEPPVSISLEDFPYPFDVEYMPLRVLGEDLRMAYMDVAPTVGSNGQTVVLLHGLNFFGEYWGGTMDALRSQGFRVLAVDQIGFGRSSKPLLPYSLGQHAANTRDLLDHLGIDRAAIVGHSFGGMLATRFALVYPDVTTHLVLVNQIGLKDQRLERPWRRTEDVYLDELERDYAFIRGTFEDYYVDWRPEFERHVRVHHGWTQSPDWPRLAMIRALNRQVVYSEPVVYDWPHIQVPTLVIGGEVDGPDFPDLARASAEAIPDARLILLREVGHNPHLEAPERFQAALVEFLLGG